MRHPAARAASLRFNFYFERFCVDEGGYLERADVSYRHNFQPDRLPDAGNGAVPDTARFETLFAFLVQCVLGFVLDHNDQFVFASNYRPGNIETEGQVAAPVFADLLSVYPNLARKIHRPKVQPDYFSRFGSDLKAAPIPKLLIRLENVLNSGKH